MDHIIRTLYAYGITDPRTIRCVVILMLDGVHDSSIRNAAGELSKMNKAELELAMQQVLGGC